MSIKDLKEIITKIIKNFTYILFFCHISSAYALTLEEAIKSAYTTNPGYKSAKETYNIAKLAKSSALTTALPNIYAGANYSNNKNQNYFSNSTRQKGTSANLTLEQQLFSGGQTIFSLKKSKLTTAQAQQQLKASEQNLLYDTIAAYLNIIHTKELYEHAKLNEIALKQNLNIVEAKVELGSSTYSDLLQTKAQLAQASAQTLQYAADFKFAQTSFLMITGIAPNNLQPVPYTSSSLPTTLAEMQQKVQLYNTDYNIAKLAVKGAKQDRNLAASQFSPTVNFIGQVSRNHANHPNNNINKKNTAIGISVNLPLFQSGGEYVGMREAKYNYQKAKYDSISSLNNITQQASNIWNIYEISQATIAYWQASVDAADLALKITKKEVEIGLKANIDYLDAEAKAFDTHVELANAKNNYLTSIFSIKMLIGELTLNHLNIQM